ncbi:hypothetical protein [uncultured Roseobacter sp.]|uniref:hypothetical protein n=1 Tax=uncultured Roseobacter sp. TaxID=114847 RepID=UPI00262BAE8C|nr:hypothetical protein [uncultured Roseobacter sp.]
MQEKETSSDIPSGANGTADAIADTNWESRLSKARARRAEVLSARTMAKTAQTVAKTRAPEAAPTVPEAADGAEPGDAAAETNTELGLRLTGKDAARALFVFAGSLGFALGAVLGIGILIGVGSTAGSQQSGIAQIQTTPVPSAEVPANTLQAIATGPEPVPTTRDTASLPTGETVSATPAPEAPALQVSVSSLPAVPALTGAPLPDDAVLLVDSQKLQPARPSDDLPVDVTPVLLTGLVPPEPLKARDTPLPEITQITYMSVDLTPADAAVMRSLAVPAAVPDTFSPLQPTVPAYFVHAPDGVSTSRLQGYIAQIEASGVAVAGIGRETFRVSSTHLRYYSPEMQEAAASLADDLGVPARDFTGNAIVPGRIEIWVAGRPRVAPAPVVEERIPWWRRNREDR